MLSCLWGSEDPVRCRHHYLCLLSLIHQETTANQPLVHISIPLPLLIPNHLLSPVPSKDYGLILAERWEMEKVYTFFKMPVSLSVSQSMIICPSFLLSRSWNTFRKEASVMVSTFTEVTSQFLSAAVSRTFCSTDSPVAWGKRKKQNKQRI